MLVLHECPMLTARYLPDKLLSTLLIESANYLATAHRVHDGKPGRLLPFGAKAYSYPYAWVLPAEHETQPFLPLVTQPAHPWSQWTRQTSGNYLWMQCLHEQMCREYAFRFSSPHGFSRFAARLMEWPRTLFEDDRTEFPVIVPSHLIARDLTGSPMVIESYRPYCIALGEGSWTRRTEPEWWSTERRYLRATTTKAGIPMEFAGRMNS